MSERQSDDWIVPTLLAIATWVCFAGFVICISSWVGIMLYPIVDGLLKP